MCSRLSQEGVHSRVHGPANHMDGPRPHRWAWRVFQNGEIDDARQGVPAHARPWKPSVRTCMLTRVCSSQCAGDARPSTPPPPPSSLPPLPPSPLPPRCCCRRRRCRHASPCPLRRRSDTPSGTCLRDLGSDGGCACFARGWSVFCWELRWGSVGCGGTVRKHVDALCYMFACCPPCPVLYRAMVVV